MKNIVLPIAIVALLMVSCHRGQTTKVDNSSEPKTLVSQIDYSGCWGGGLRTVSLKYDDENRLVEMVSSTTDEPTTIKYEGNSVVVEKENPIAYSIGDDKVTETFGMGDAPLLIVYTLKDGKLQERAVSSESGGSTINYRWEGNCIAEKKTVDNCYGDITESTTRYTYGQVKNLFNVDVFCIIDDYDLNEPTVGTLAKGFISEYLPEKVIWEGDMDGYVPTTITTQYDYVVNDGLVTEVHITKTTVTDYPAIDEGDEVEVKTCNMTVKIRY